LGIKLAMETGRKFNFTVDFNEVTFRS
jgi:hypothetical protein